MKQTELPFGRKPILSHLSAPELEKWVIEGFIKCTMRTGQRYFVGEKKEVINKMRNAYHAQRTKLQRTGASLVNPMDARFDRIVTDIIPMAKHIKNPLAISLLAALLRPEVLPDTREFAATHSIEWSALVKIINDALMDILEAGRANTRRT